MEMPKRSIHFGWGLVLLGGVGHAASGQASLTALIPAAFGILLIFSGVLARRTGSSKHPMHFAAVLALLGLLGSASGLVDLVSLLRDGATANPLAAASRSAMAVAMAVFLGYCVQSFRAARRAA